MPRSSWQEAEEPERVAFPDTADHVRDNVVDALPRRDMLNPHHNFETLALDSLERIERLLQIINLRLAGRP